MCVGTRWLFKSRWLAFIGYLLWAFAGISMQVTANACTICVPFPSRTTADDLVEGQTVVLARENPDKHWSYIIVETLKGVSDLSPIDHFIDSKTRRMLTIYPQRGVVFVQDKNDKTKWRNLGFADAEYEQVIREIIQVAPQWQQTETGNDQRLVYFAKYLGHKNRRLHELAYLEVGRAPYGKIKHLNTGWSREQIRALLRNPAYFEWYPLAILMLAHNANANDREYINNRFSTHVNFGLSMNLSAWATAMIEIEGKKGIVEIEQKYFRSSVRTQEELTAVVAALSEHGSNGHTYLRDQIVQSYSTLLTHHPKMASYVAKDLMTWRRWELSDQLSKIMTNGNDIDPLNAYALKLYFAESKKDRLPIN